MDKCSLAHAQNVMDDIGMRSIFSGIKHEVRPGSVARCFHSSFDIAIMNPPFGTKSRSHADTLFVSEALCVAPRVYSLHLKSTREFFPRWAERCSTSTRKITSTLLAEMRYDLPASYRKHRHAHRDIFVDLVRWDVEENG